MRAHGEENQTELYGVKGWLLALCIWLALVSPLFSVGFLLFLTGRMGQVYPDQAEEFAASGMLQTMWLIVIVREAIKIAAAVLLWRRLVPSTKWIAIALIWISGPIFIMFAALVTDAEALNVRGLARSFLLVSAMTAYLLVSKRVKQTYAKSISL